MRLDRFRRHVALGAWALATGCLLTSCEPAPDIEPSACRNPVPAVAELGTGDLNTGFKPMADGADALVTLGPQGLHMILVSVKLTGFEAPPAGGGRSQLWLSVRSQDTFLGAIPATEKPVVLDDKTVAFLGLRPAMTLDNVSAYFGKLSEVEVTIRDGCDRLIHAKRMVRLVQ